MPCPRSADTTNPIVVVCSEGYASSLAADSLVDLGFAPAGDLDGGYRPGGAGGRARPRPPPRTAELIRRGIPRPSRPVQLSEGHLPRGASSPGLEQEQTDGES